MLCLWSKGDIWQTSFRSAVLKVEPLIHSNIDIDFMISEGGERVERLASKIKENKTIAEQQ